MSIASRTLTINAAFLLEIKEDNRHLRELLCSTRELCQNSLGHRHSPREVADIFSELRDQLAMHFALEDAYGYFEDAVTEAPRLTEQAAALRHQHCDLFLSIRDLADHAEQLLYSRHLDRELRVLQEAFGRFYDQLQMHEQRENELIMAAFDDDIGVGD